MLPPRVEALQTNQGGRDDPETPDRRDLHHDSHAGDNHTDGDQDRQKRGRSRRGGRSRTPGRPEATGSGRAIRPALTGVGMYIGTKVKTKSAKPMANGEPQLLCRGYNAANGCSRTDCKYRHHCDILLENGHVCDKQHLRQEHKKDIHGSTIAA